MEESLDQYKRAEKLAKAQLTGRALPIGPMTFLTPDSLPAPSEPSMLENVITTVSSSAVPLPDFTQVSCKAYDKGNIALHLETKMARR